MSTPAPILQYTLNNKDLLPAGYTPLAYIESTTSGYIDLGLKGNNNTIVTLDFVSLDTECKALFGNRSSYNSNALAIFSCWSSSLFCNWGTTYDGLDGAYYSGKRYHIFINKNAWYVNGASAKTFTSTTFTTPSNLAIGGADGSAGGTKTRYYHCAISEGTTPKRDLKPCIRDSDGRVGMYDVIDNTFYCPSSNTFIAGPPLAVGKGGGKSLPEEYLLVEWLQGTGTQWINTNVTCGTTDVINTTWTIDAEGANAEWQGINGQMLLKVGNNTVSDGVNTINISKLTNVEYNYNNGSSILKVGSTSYTRSWGLREALPICLWKMSDYSGSLNNCKISKFKVSNSSSVIRNMYACYRKSDMKPGMYDTVNGVFYTNVGSGEFILGPTITNCYTWEPNAGSGTLQGLYTNLSGIYDSSKGWVAHCTGQGSHIQLPALGSLITNGTVAVWCKLNTPSNRHLFIGNDALSKWIGAWETSDRNLYHGSSGSITNYIDGVAKSTVPNDSNWHFYCFTGVNLSQWGSENLFLNHYGTSSYNVNCEYQNLMIFDTALTAAQVKELYGK